MAGTYHWSLEQIFDYTTVDDLNELMKYAPHRIKREQNNNWRTLLSIVSVGSFHDKGADKEYKKLMREFQDRDDKFNYVEQKFDKTAFEAFAAQRAANLRRK